MKEQDVRTVLANKLREFRLAAKLTAKEVGERIGKSDKTISGWEHGRGQPDADMLFKLCDLYGIESFDVFYGRNENEFALSEDETELVNLYRSFNADGKKLFMETARTFAGNPSMQKENTIKSAI